MPVKAPVSFRKAPSADELRKRKSRSTRSKRDPSTTVPPVDRVIRWKSGVTVRRLSIYLPPEIALELKAHCAGIDRKLSSTMLELVCGLLGRNPADYPDHH